MPIDDLLMVEKYGKKSFNLDVPDRVTCMTALVETGEYAPTDAASESVRNLAARYAELEDVFPDELREEALPFFIDWLIYRVQLVQITAYTDDDAYTIFETMNDRGLKLTPADMLKGYLLANIAEGSPRTKANDLWRQRMLQLRDLDKDGDSDFLKTWLRSQYAKNIRKREKNAKPEDWDRIGTEFHRWLRGQAKTVGLLKQANFYDFVTVDLDYYARQYTRIVKAASWQSADPRLVHIGYNADRGFTLQHQVLLAPLTTSDSDDVAATKMDLVARYIDTLLAWRVWNFRMLAYSTMSYAMFLVMRDIRGMSVPDLANHLHGLLMAETETFDSNDRLYVHQQNRFQLQLMLARITDYLGVQSGEAPRYREYTNAEGVRYEVEHIWADHYERHTDEFSHPHEFAEHRNLIGDLLLLPKRFNASYNDDPYAKKLPHYLEQNILARSLHPQSYAKNPGFLQFVETTGLPFKPYETLPRGTSSNVAGSTEPSPNGSGTPTTCFESPACNRRRTADVHRSQALPGLPPERRERADCPFPLGCSGDADAVLRSRSERNRPDLPLLSVARERGVFVRTADDDNHNVIPEDLSNYKIARIGDLVVNKMKAWQGSLGLAPCDGVVSPAYFVFDFDIADRFYGQALLRSKPYVALFAAASDGVRIGQWDLVPARMREIPVLLPPPDEQAAIVRYLAHANRRIDKAIAAKRKLIRLLEEQNRVIVNLAVTRGLDPDAPTKDSDVPGLGMIPSHWDVSRLKLV